MKLADLLQELMVVPAPSGYESEMKIKMQSYFERFCDSVETDLLGNCIGLIKGREPTVPKLMIFGHMDSLGMIVRKVEDDGFVRVERLGGLPEKVLPGTEFIVRSEEGRWYPAVLGPKSHHVTPPEEKYTVDKISTLALDLGLSSAEAVNQLGIYTGCPVVYKPRAMVLPGGKISGTFIDNRGACSCLIKLAELLSGNRPKGDVYVVATVQEEFNLRGAMMASRSIKPDLAIGVDVTIAGDTVDLKHCFDATLGKGPCVQFYTFHGRGTLNGNLAHEPLFQLLKETARAEGFALQRTTGLGMLTDSSYLQLEGKGVGVLDVGFATRYTHTPVETVDPDDIDQLASLLGHVARRIDQHTRLGRLA